MISQSGSKWNRVGSRSALAISAAFAASLSAVGAPAPAAVVNGASDVVAASQSAMQQGFASPDQAGEALAAAWRSGHSAELLKIFGPAGLPLVRSGDSVADHHARQRLAAAYGLSHRIDLEAGGKAVLIIGQEAWPYPIPLIKQGDIWRFDVNAGARQIIDRRIGRNEMRVITTAREYVNAQRDYAARTAANGGRREYAQRIASTQGERDGLYWPASNSEDESPLGPQVAAAEARGYPPPGDTDRQPFEGYVFRVLTAQGPHAPGGDRSYLADGHMTKGFALVAFPAKYGDSGIMTFIVNQDGIVWERNLGPDTSPIARAIDAYDPGPGWTIAEP